MVIYADASINDVVEQKIWDKEGNNVTLTHNFKEANVSSFL